jgi:hypothetical protein
MLTSSSRELIEWQNLTLSGKDCQVKIDLEGLHSTCSDRRRARPRARAATRRERHPRSQICAVSAYGNDNKSTTTSEYEKSDAVRIQSQVTLTG